MSAPPPACTHPPVARDAQVLLTGLDNAIRAVGAHTAMPCGPLEHVLPHHESEFRRLVPEAGARAHRMLARLWLLAEIHISAAAETELAAGRKR